RWIGRVFFDGGLGALPFAPRRLCEVGRVFLIAESLFGRRRRLIDARSDQGDADDVGARIDRAPLRAGVPGLSIVGDVAHGVGAQRRLRGKRERAVARIGEADVGREMPQALGRDVDLGDDVAYAVLARIETRRRVLGRNAAGVFP